MPTFTVVMPLYNQARYVAEALDSVLTQTYRDLEVIVVDDGSTDGGADVVRSVADSRVKCVRQQNQGVSVARNHGISMATGEYVAFIDSDDHWLATFMERNVRFVESYPSVSIVYTNAFAGPNGQPRIDRALQNEGIVTDYFRAVLRCHKHLGNSSAMMVRKDTLCRAGGFPIGVKYNEDQDLWMRLAWIGIVGFIPEPLSVYRDNPAGSAARHTLEGIPYPPLVDTYRLWKQQGQIPARLSHSSRAFINWTLLGYVCSLANAGKLVAARALFFHECRPTYLGLRSYLAAFLLCTAPSFGRRLWRRHLRNAGTSRPQSYPIWFDESSAGAGATAGRKS
jgi:hypothetical protein